MKVRQIAFASQPLTVKRKPHQLKIPAGSRTCSCTPKAHYPPSSPHFIGYGRSTILIPDPMLIDAVPGCRVHPMRDVTQTRTVDVVRLYFFKSVLGMRHVLRFTKLLMRGKMVLGWAALCGCVNGPYILCGHEYRRMTLRRVLR